MHHKKRLKMEFGDFGHYQTIWINQAGDMKIRSTLQLPIVRNSLNPRLGYIARPLDEYKSVDIGDIDYYGWYCIEIIFVSCLTDNPPIGVEVLHNGLNKHLYQRIQRNHKQRMSRAKARNS
jgi:hypothetical protein